MERDIAIQALYGHNTSALKHEASVHKRLFWALNQTAQKHPHCLGAYGDTPMLQPSCCGIRCRDPDAISPTITKS